MEGADSAFHVAHHDSLISSFYLGVNFVFIQVGSRLGNLGALL